jgi:ribonuclease HII
MLCGIDEAGRGPVLGPMVVAGILIENDAPLRQLNVRDSKKLTPEKREALAPEIMKLVKFEIVVVSAEDIDLMRAQMSLNDFEAKIFATIIEKLNPETAYVDAADVDEIEFKKMILNELKKPVDVVSKHYADELFPVVSAASILAKVRRDAEVRKIEAEFGKPIGSGYPSDQITMTFLEEWLKEKGTLPPHCRQSWDTCKRLLTASKMHKLEEYQEAKK